MRVRMIGAAPTPEDPRLHRTLTAGDTYVVIGVERDDYRVINDAGEPVLFPKRIFEVLDRSVPGGWQLDDDGDTYYLEPIATSRPGFYEAWFDPVDPMAHETSRRVLRETLEKMRVDGSDADRVLIERDLSRLR
jgi:hypothetical protein